MAIILETSRNGKTEVARSRTRIGNGYGSYVQCGTLKEGARGDCVNLLQEKLRLAGFSQIMVDGIFGPNTKFWVQAFQQREGMTTTGVVDQATWNRLKQYNPTKGGGVIDSLLRSVEVLLPNILGTRQEPIPTPGMAPTVVEKPFLQKYLPIILIGTAGVMIVLTLKKSKRV